MKRLGFWPLFALGLNGIVGVGIFFTPAPVAKAAPGWASVVVFGAVAVALVPIALCFAKLAARFDEDGGPVLYARAAFGETTGFLVGWLSYVSAVASTAAVMSGLSRALFGPEGAQLASVICVTIIAAVTALGLSISAGLWSLLTIAKVLPLLVLVGAGLLWGQNEAASSPVAAPSYLRAALIAVFAYQGFEIVPLVAGQTDAAKRRVPLALFIALGSAALLYVALQSVVVRALPSLATSPAPLAQAAGVLVSPRFGAAIGITTSISALGIAVGMVAMTPRYLASAWPPTSRLKLAATSISGVPQRALLLTWMLVTGLLLQGSLSQLLELSSMAVLSQYGATSAALGVLAFRREHGLTRRDAWVVPPALLVTAVLMAQGTQRGALVGGALVIVGLGLWLVTRPAPT